VKKKKKKKEREIKKKKKKQTGVGGERERKVLKGRREHQLFYSTGGSNLTNSLEGKTLCEGT